jgi:hypothetical protein
VGSEYRDPGGKGTHAYRSTTMDFSTLDSKAAAEEGAVIELQDWRKDGPLLDDDGKPYWIEVLGMDSEKLRKVSKSITGKRITDIRRGKGAEYDAEAEDAERARLYAAATKSWYIPTFDGQALECNEKNARRLYSDPRFPWLVEQIDREIANRQRFFKKASPSS